MQTQISQRCTDIVQLAVVYTLVVPVLVFPLREFSVHLDAFETSQFTEEFLVHILQYVIGNALLVYHVALIDVLRVFLRMTVDLEVDVLTHQHVMIACDSLDKRLE